MLADTVPKDFVESTPESIARALPALPDPVRMTASSAGPRRCAHHPERPAHALCVSCRTPLCRGCATPWEGIFLCAACLAARRAAAVRRGSVAGWIGLAAGLAAAALAATWMTAWVAALFAGLAG
ncbi:MAG TPA: B-box zinc finger protein [Thermoanaerobaculia bacterium]|nr:B-box zinc finger protein [Thermoanaerobaculia bacterium]